MTVGDINIGITEEGALPAAGNIDKLAGSTTRLSGYLKQLSDSLALAADAEIRLGDGSLIGASGVDALAAATDRAATAAGAAETVNRTYTQTLILEGREIQLTAGSLAELTAMREKEIAQTAAVVASNEAVSASYAGLATASVDASVASGIAAKNMSPMYRGLTSMEAMGTPAVLKAATWGLLLSGGIAYEGIKNYVSFQKAITQSITQAGVNPSQRPFLMNMAESVSKMSGLKLNDVANSIYRIASGTASWNGGLGATKKQLTDITTQIANLQVLGDVPTGAASEQASRVITAMINTNLRGVGNSSRRASMLINAVVGSGDMRLADLIPGVGRGLLVSAKANNMTAKDALAWTALLTSKGTTASVAGNYVKTGINLLANPSAQGTLAMAMLGIKPGEMQGLIGSKGGLSSALKVLVAGMKQFNVSPQFVGYRDKIGNPRVGGTGTAAAINKLQTWTVGELTALHPDLLKRFEHGGSYKSGGLSAKEQTYINDLFLTKAFGGSKQFATIAAITSDPQKFYSILTAINRKDNPAYYSKALGAAYQTPSQKFKIDWQNIMVDLVKVGQAVTPMLLAIASGFTKLIGLFTKFKPVLLGLITPLLAMIGIATISKISSMGKGMYHMMGGALNLHGKLAGKSGLSFMQQHAPRLAADGSYARNGAGQIVAMDGSIMGGQTARNAASMSANEAMSVLGTKLAINTTVLGENTDALLGKGTLGGRGGMGGGGGSGGGVRGKIGKVEASGSPRRLQMRDSKGRLLSYAESQKLSNFTSSAESSAAYYGYSPRGTPPRALGKTGGFISQELMGDRASVIAKTGANLESTVVADSGGMMSKVAGMAGGAMGMLGGPMGMMAASVILPMLAPAIMHGLGSLGGVLGRFFGTNTTPIKQVGVGGINTFSKNTSHIASLKKQLKTLGYHRATADRATTLEYDKLSSELRNAQGLEPAFRRDKMKSYRHAKAVITDHGLAAAIKFTAKDQGLFRGRGGMYEGNAAYEANLDRKLLIGLNPRGHEYATLENLIYGATSGKKLPGATTSYGFLHNQSGSTFQKYVHGQLKQFVTKANGVFGPLAFADKLKGVGPGKLFADETNILAAQGNIANQANYGNVNQNLSLKGLNKSNYAQRESDASGYVATFLSLAKKDFATSKATKDPIVAEMWKGAAKQAAAEAAKFTEFEKVMTDKMKKVKIDSASIEEWATKMDSKNGALYQRLQMTGQGMGQAFKAAITSSDSFLAGLVNGANATAHARGNKTGP